MRKSLFFSLLIIAALAVSSCLGKNDALYSETTIGNIVNGKFYNDFGVNYQFTEQSCAGVIDTLRRAIVTCDVLEKVSETQLNARLTSFASVSMIMPKSMLNYSDEALGTDAVNLSQGWFTGDYLNILYNITVVNNSSIRHTLDLAFDAARSTGDTLYFELRHNGFGEVYDNPEVSQSCVVASGYASFPIRQLMPSDRKQVNVTVSWNWYRSNGEVLTTEIEPNTVTAVYSVE